MNLIDLDRLGARETRPWVLDFGILLPGISPLDGYELVVRIIHAKDQFLQKIPTLDFPMDHSTDPDYGDYWSTRVPLDQAKKRGIRSSWGLPGRYVYRYHLTNTEKNADLDWIIDPFAREYGIGKLSAVTVGYKPYPWSRSEMHWKTPAQPDLVVYELMISEFGGSIDGTIARLDYLADLGINGIEVMPVSNVDSVIDWGYLPIGYFGVDERFGKRKDFQRLVDEAHRHGIAVIVDAVYGHTSNHFPYAYIWKTLQLNNPPDPFSGRFVESRYGESVNFRLRFVQDFFFTVNMFWLDRFHVDGFRYDCVPEYYDGPVGAGYANLVHATCQEVKARSRAGGHWARFSDGDTFNLVQCAEYLDHPAEILSRTFSTCVWQDSTLRTAAGVARGNRDAIAGFAWSLDLYGYPQDAGPLSGGVQKSAFQYLENHDHSRFISHFGTTETDNDLLREGRRELFYRNRPYLIALLLAKGIPFLWQGQEFCENYCIPAEGRGRVLMLRPMRWDFFYDPFGKATVDLVRRLIRLRRDNNHFRRGDLYFYNHHDHYQSRNVLLFSRYDSMVFSLVALNFGDHDTTVPFTFPYDGDYREELHGTENLAGVIAGREWSIPIPRHYGRVWTTAIQ